MAEGVALVRAQGLRTLVPLFRDYRQMQPRYCQPDPNLLELHLVVVFQGYYAISHRQQS